MKIAIHKNDKSYSLFWEQYCIQNNIPYKVVNAYDNDIVKQISDCDIFLWHHDHINYKDTNFAKQLLYSLQFGGIKVYPDFTTTWHFDDKVGQKYLFEALNIPHVDTYVFYSKTEAKKWAQTANFPKVFKLRCGAGSSNVRLVKTKRQALSLINKAFGRGFATISAVGNFKEAFALFTKGKSSLYNLMKKTYRLFIPSTMMRMRPKQKGYIYFQDFVPNLTEDFRLQFVGKRCWAMIRKVRENDFRASGSNNMMFDHNRIPPEMLTLAYNIVEKLSLQSCAFDFVILKDGSIKLLEISYGFGIDVEHKNGQLFVDEFTHGYWDENKNWHDGTFMPLNWIIEQFLAPQKTTL